MLVVAALVSAEAAAGTGVVRRRFSIAVGANDGRADRPLKHATSDARGFNAVLRHLGGVRTEDSTLLADPTTAQVLSALSDARAQLEAARREVRSTEVVFYFSGHSDETGIWLKGERLAFADLRAALREIPADFRITVLDSCSSGAFMRTKGGTRVAPFLVDESTRVTGEAVLTSSAETEASQESDQLGGSFFTHHLVSGLRGAADSSGDGKVTLDEAYRFAFHRTLQRTERTVAGVQHPAYEMTLAGSGEVVVTDLRANTAVLAIPAAMRGQLFVRTAKGALVAELTKAEGLPVELGVEDGAYNVTLVDGGEWLGGTVDVRGGRTEVARATLRTVPAEDHLVRGLGERSVRSTRWNQLLRVSPAYLVGSGPSVALSARFYLSPLADDRTTNVHAQEFVQHPGVAEFSFSAEQLLGASFEATLYPWSRTGITARGDGQLRPGMSGTIGIGVVQYLARAWRAGLLVESGSAPLPFFVAGDEVFASQSAWQGAKVSTSVLLADEWLSTLEIGYRRDAAVETTEVDGTNLLQRTRMDSINLRVGTDVFVNRQLSLGLNGLAAISSSVRVNDDTRPAGSLLSFGGDLRVEWAFTDWMSAAAMARADWLGSAAGQPSRFVVGPAMELSFRL